MDWVVKIDQAGKDVQQFRMIKDRDINVLMTAVIELISWKEYFEELMNVENEKQRKMDGGQ